MIKHRPERPAGYARLGVQGLVVEHRHAGGLAARARGGGHGHQGLQGHRHRLTEAWANIIANMYCLRRKSTVSNH